MFYRVISPQNKGNVSPVLPGHRNTTTGFWTTNPDAIVAILAYQINWSRWLTGGGIPWPEELAVLEAETVEITTPPPGTKTNHWPDTDTDEVFVSTPPSILRQVDYETWLNERGIQTWQL